MPLDADYEADGDVRTLSSGGRLVRCRSTSGTRVALKVVEPSDASGLERLRNEYEIGRLVPTASILHPLRLGTWGGSPALVLEGFDGTTLDALLVAPLPIDRFLVVARGIVRALGELHDAGVVHRDLKPANVLVGAEGEVRLSGLGLASWGRTRRTSAIEGSLAYMSPEQTGRLSLPGDPRSDLYSLGVTFYEMLGGRLPFDAKDPSEWIHCHVARAPLSLDRVRPSLPPPLVAIVMKLLAKPVDERYQSTRGLVHDLDLCAAQMAGTGQILPFSIGANDDPVHFQIPPRLYGRAEHVATLRAELAAVVEGAGPRLLLLSGLAGSGKTRLVDETEASITRAGATLVRGKSDRQKPDVPYAPFLQAFREAVRQLLTEAEEPFDAFRRRLLSTLGVNARLIVDVIPEMGLVIGQPAPVVDLPPVEARNRFRNVFRQLVGVFAHEGRPLTVFLDDLQWTDPASLMLLEDLLSHQELRFLSFIGAYRSDEVDASHPLATFLRRLQDAGRTVERMAVGPLPRDDLAALIRDAFRGPRDAATSLAELIDRKTGGSPFFAVQFLTALVDEGLVTRGGPANAWGWDEARIEEKGFTDNVVDFMVGQLARHSTRARDALAHVAALGNVAKVSTLAQILERTEEEVRADLQEAARAGLVSLEGETCRFVHDRVQEAAYVFVEEASRPAMHRRIGRWLAANLPDDATDRRLFDAVNQLNRGLVLATDVDEHRLVRRLNIRAGAQAKTAVAFPAAQSYLLQAVALLDDDTWEASYAETFALHLELAECESLVGDFDRADERFVLLLGRARGNVDRARAAVLRARLFQLTGNFGGAVEVVLDALRRSGVAFPDRADVPRTTYREQAEIAVKLRGRTIEDLVDAPEAHDPEARAIISLYVAAIPCANVGTPELYPLFIIRALHHALDHGNTADVCFAYGAYGSLLVALFADVPSAFAFSEMAIRLNDKIGDARLRGALLYLQTHYVHGWGRPFAALRPLDEIHTALLQVGDLLFVGYNAFNTAWMSVERGDSLDAALVLARAQVQVVDSVCHNERLVRSMLVHVQFLRALKGETKGPVSFDADDFDEAGWLAKTTEARLETVTAFFHIAKLWLCFLHHRHEEALEHADAVVPLLGSVMGGPVEATYHFYLALTLAAFEPSADDVREARRSRLDASMTKLRSWSTSCPSNYESRYALVAAEVARLDGRTSEAMVLYEQAIRSASDHGLVHNEAIALELAAAHYRAERFGRIAETYEAEARARWVRWGALAKVHPTDLGFPLAEAQAVDPGSTFTVRAEQLDLHAIVAALQTISGVIVTGDLVRTLLRIVLEQGGAQRAVLFVRDGSGILGVAAEATEMGVTVAESPARPSAEQLPQSIVDYVWRTSERVVVGDVSGRHRFTTDPYLTSAKVRSLLCQPILRQSRLEGLLYLENRLVPGAFTKARVSVLELVAAQAAISLENARLYAERTAAEAAMRASEERFRLLVDGVNDCALFMLDRQGDVSVWNAGAERLFGYGVDEIVGRSGRCLYADDDANRRADERSLTEAAVAGSFAEDGLRRRKDGSRFSADAVVTALRDEHGALTHYSVLVRDVTQRLKLEEMVREAQKMEAIGRLAGGVAHDFNNLLGAIYGLVHHGLRRSTAGSAIASDLEEIQATARKAGELTKQLLAFARRQRIEPRVFDLNALVTSMDRLLRRVLGDDIELTTSIGRPIALIEADPGQIEQVVLNLAVNARDAMPKGGRLTIETSGVELGEDYARLHADVTPGPYVMIAISDTGSGMPPEVLEHLFEPFFTTKEPGLGTGLGLATSYGIVKQAGGHVWVYSEVGRGTTFKVYLPRSPLRATEPRPAPPATAPVARGETILLVEDHASLRRLVMDGLEAIGYRVIAAANGDDALRLAEAHEGEIDLLITDLVMPKMSGQELARRLASTRPRVKVLCVSGYTEISLSGDLGLGPLPGPGPGEDRRPALEFLSKPFTPDELATKVRTILDAPSTDQAQAGVFP